MKEGPILHRHLKPQKIVIFFTLKGDINDKNAKNN